MTVIRKWGNSLALRIPQNLADEIGLSEGNKVELVKRGKGLSVQPIVEEELTLDILLSKITPQNKHSIIDWGKPVGKEIW